jgi:hypothetical protein
MPLHGPDIGAQMVVVGADPTNGNRRFTRAVRRRVITRISHDRGRRRSARPEIVVPLLANGIRAVRETVPDRIGRAGEGRDQGRSGGKPDSGTISDHGSKIAAGPGIEKSAPVPAGALEQAFTRPIAIAPRGLAPREASLPRMFAKAVRLP